MAAGRPFLFHVEQQSLKFLIDPREMGLEYHKRVRKLLGFDFQLQKNRVAMHYLDASHRTSLVGPWFQAQDPFLAQLINEIKEGKTIKGFSMEHNQLLYKGRKVIPSSSHTRSAPPLWWFSIWGYSSDRKTYLRLAVEWYWRACVRWPHPMSNNVPSVSNMKRPPNPPPTSYNNLWPKFGRTLQWILRRVCRAPRGFTKYSPYIELKHPFVHSHDGRNLHQGNLSAFTDS